MDDRDLSPYKWQADGKHTFSLCRQNLRKPLIINGAPERIRTTNLLIRSQMLYPVELRAHYLGKPMVGGDFACHFYGYLLRSSKMKVYATQ